MNRRVYDKQAALDRAGGNPDTARRLLDMLHEHLTQAETALSRALARGDVNELKKAAHRLAGAAPYCGASALHAAAKRLEAQSREADRELNAVLARDLIGQIEEFRRATTPEASVRQ